MSDFPKPSSCRNRINQGAAFCGRPLMKPVHPSVDPSETCQDIRIDSATSPAIGSPSRAAFLDRSFRMMIGVGDTAGHIHMAVAIAEQASMCFPAAEVVLIGAAGRFPSERMHDSRYDILFLDINPYDRTNPINNLRLPFDFLRSLHQSLGILAKHRPHVVLGLGGYPTGPFVLAAGMRHIPTLLLEPNLLPGLANRFLATVADRICVSFEETGACFPPRKTTLTGTPVRQAALPSNITRKEACAAFDLDPALKTVLIMGGSLGLEGINQALLHKAHRLSANGIQIVWQTGDRHFAQIHAGIHRKDTARCRIFPFIPSIAPAYAAADLVVTAAGAVTMAELALWRKPAIVVPSAKATEGHQISNAQAYADAGACILVREETAAATLTDTILAVICRPEELRALSRGIGAFARPDARALVMREIQALTAMRRF